MDFARFLPIARGDEPDDLLLRDGQVVNIFTGEILEADRTLAQGTVGGGFPV